MKGNIKRPTSAASSQGGYSDPHSAAEDVGASQGSTVNLTEDAVEARERAERATAGLRQSEALLAQELADTKELQAISALLIRGESVDVLYSKIVEAAMKLLHSDMGSMQMI